MVLEYTLLNVIRSVTRNVTSIMLTFILAIIFIYVYSIIGYIFFPDDFQLSTNPIVAGQGTCPGGESHD